uniref:Adenosine A1 receptor n=1 Tax=Hucho hucho TaxID=62062 RepID=A0A4W5K410_9TELE
MRVVTKQRAAVAVVVCWTVAFIVGLTPMLGWNNLWRLQQNGSLNEDLIITCHISSGYYNISLYYYNKELKLAKSLALVLFLFAISWLPLHIINCITLFCPTCDKPLFLIYIAILLTHGNSAVNPIIYAFRIKKFRDAFLNIWKQYFCCKDVPPEEDWPHLRAWFLSRFLPRFLPF